METRLYICQLFSLEIIALRSSYDNKHRFIRRRNTAIIWQWSLFHRINAEIETREAGSLEAGGLPGYLEVLFVEIWNKCGEVFSKLCSTLFYTNNKRHEVLNFTQNIYMFKILGERKMVCPYR
jgi:hypothetical protein